MSGATVKDYLTVQLGCTVGSQCAAFPGPTLKDYLMVELSIAKQGGCQ